jgi:hypothetical protein
MWASLRNRDVVINVITRLKVPTIKTRFAYQWIHHQISPIRTTLNITLPLLDPILVAMKIVLIQVGLLPLATTGPYRGLVGLVIGIAIGPIPIRVAGLLGRTRTPVGAILCPRHLRFISGTTDHTLLFHDSSQKPFTNPVGEVHLSTGVLTHG